jgi:CheY-like chemotaxis protein
VDAVTEKAKILLVDDRQENLLALEAILSSLDQRLVRASSGEEALKALLTEEFAVILLDVKMPGLDGFETASHIKRREKTKDVPIIFLTAYDDEPQQAFRGYAAGAVDYIAKPFDPWVLRAKVSVFVDLYLKNRQLGEQAGLLRRTLGKASGRGGARAAAELVTELDGRLATVEDGLRTLQKAIDETPVPHPGAQDDGEPPGGGTTGALVELERRVARLRAALDAFTAGH